MTKYGTSDLSSVNVSLKGKSKVVLPVNVVDVFNWRNTAGKWVTFRLFGDVVCTGNYWVTTKNKEGKKVRFPAPCLSFNPRTGTRDPGKYDPWWEVEQREAEEGIEPKDRTVQFQVQYFMNAIIRSEQENEPSRIRMTSEEKETHFKDKESNSWTPVRVVRLTKSLIMKIQGLKPLNSVKFKSGSIKCFDVSDAKYGRDVRVKFDDTGSPANMYEVHPGDERTPLTEEEQNYLIYDLDLLFSEEASENDVRLDYESWAKRMGYTTAKAKSKKVEDEVDDDSFEEDEEEKAPAKSRKAKKKPVVEDEDDDFDEDDDDDFEDEEEEKPKKKLSKSRKPAVEDEEDDDSDFDEDEDDDFEEEEKPKKKPSKKKPVVEVDDDDFEDEEEEEKAPAKKSKKVVKKVVEEEEEEEEDDFDDDDDFEEEEAPKKKKPVKKAPAKPSKKKPVVEDDDDDDFDEEEDDF